MIFLPVFKGNTFFKSKTEISGRHILSADCLLNGTLHINNGTLAIPNGKTLALSNGNKIIIDNAATSNIIIESGGKLVLNKAGN